MPTLDPQATLAASLSRQASRTVINIVKRQARRYARHPFQMDIVWSGLSCASPSTVIAVAAHLAERHAMSGAPVQRGSEVLTLNLRALLLLGRVRRRAERHDAAADR